MIITFFHSKILEDIILKKCVSKHFHQEESFFKSFSTKIAEKEGKVKIGVQVPVKGKKQRKVFESHPVLDILYEYFQIYTVAGICLGLGKSSKQVNHFGSFKRGTSISKSLPRALFK